MREMMNMKLQNGFRIAAKTFKKSTMVAVATIVAASGMIGGIAIPKASAVANTYYVSTAGSDTNPGTESLPWRTVTRSIKALLPGDTLFVRGGTYSERIQNPVIQPGTSTAGITVSAYPGERPVISGLLWLRDASYWTLDGINVTWGSTNIATEHMTKMTGGTGWRITNAEIWGARSFAGLLVAGAPNNWRVDHSIFHDTYPSNSTNQDHLIYVNTDSTLGSGLIEQNIFYNSPNGRGLKVGPPSSTVNPIGAVTVRYNTFYNNTGPSNIQLSYGASNNKIYRNIFQKTGSANANVTDYNVNGTGNQVFNNIGWESVAVTDPSLADASNLWIDPQFTNAPAYDFTPTNPAAALYGRYATVTNETGPTPDTTPPTTPIDIIVGLVSNTSAAISWTASTDNVGVINYDIYRDGIKVGSSPATSFNDSSLVANTSYSYSVSALDAAGNVSPLSAPLSVTTLNTVILPNAPGSLAASQITGTSVSLNWTASTEGTIASYDIYRNGAKVGSTTSLSYSDTGLTPATSYSYTVTAVDIAGNVSPSTSPLSIKTFDTIAPSAPSTLVSNQVSGTSVTISWNASSDNVGVASYNIYRGATMVGSSATTSFTNSGLTSNTLYSFTVVAVDTSGNLSPSSTALQVRTLDTTAPTTPTGLKVTATGNTTVSLSWTASTDNVGVVAYNVYRNGSTTPIARVTGTTFTDSGLARRTSYTYTVRAVDAAGNLSNLSSSVKGTTK